MALHLVLPPVQVGRRRHVLRLRGREYANGFWSIALSQIALMLARSLPSAAPPKTEMILTLGCESLKRRVAARHWGAPAPTFGAHCVPPSLPISSRYLSRSVVGRDGGREEGWEGASYRVFLLVFIGHDAKRTKEQRGKERARACTTTMLHACSGNHHQRGGGSGRDQPRRL